MAASPGGVCAVAGRGTIIGRSAMDDNAAGMHPDGERLEDIGIDGIMRALPHRHPFLMVDRMIEIRANESATGVKCVTASEPHFQGHFPEKPIMPGVLIIEAMAQTAAVLVIVSQNIDPTGKLVYFMSINEARFRRPVVPGDVLHIEVKKLRHRDKVWKFEGKAKVDGKVVAEAVYTAMVMDS
jgi:3-hydroxyacyl-[acyl-carrier-protein] dehydratase